MQFSVLAIIMLPEMIARCCIAGGSLNPAVLWAPQVKGRKSEHSHIGAIAAGAAHG